MNFAQTLRKLESVSSIKPYRTGMSASRLPFCPLDQVLNLILKFWDNSELTFYEYFYNSFSYKPSKVLNWESEMYMSIGNTAHEVTQRYLSKLGILIGDYTCECGHEEKLSKQSKCPKCKELMEYQELKIPPENDYYSSNYIDLVLDLDEMYLADIKTTKTSALRRMKQIRFEYLMQIAFYYFKLKEVYDIEADKIGILFVPRDRPSNFQFKEFKNKKILEKLYLRYKVDSKFIINSYQSGDFSKLPRSCKSKKDADFKKCPYRFECFTDLTNFKNHIKQIWEIHKG